VRQPLDLPDAWRFNADEDSTLYNDSWWLQFKDPVLTNLIITALKNNQDIRVAIYRVREFYARLGVVSADQYPGVTGNASYMRRKLSSERGGEADRLSVKNKANIGRNLRTFPPFNEYQAFLNFNWALDFWSRYYSASEAAYEEYLGTIQARRSVVITVVTSVAMTYIKLRDLDAQLLISKQTLKSRYESLKLAKDRFELGETSSLEVIQAQAEIEIAALRVIEFEREIPLAEDQLSVLLGENPRWIERGSSIQEFMYPISIPAGLPSDLLTRRPDIVQAEDAVKAANARVTEARALLFPQFNLTAAYGSESTQLKTFLTSPTEMWQYGVTAVQTIFDAGRTFYGIEEASAIREEALATYRQTILKAFQEVNDALVQV
jgi:multidrug efflux system outer membrane protein